MKTTLDLPDDLLREIKIRAVHEDRRIKDVVADALRLGLARERETATAVRRRVALPLVDCDAAVDLADEITPERAAAILLAEEASDAEPPG